MSKTLIEWVKNPDGTQGYTWNPITGCLGPKGDGVRCPYCYARRLANERLKQRYLANKNIAPISLESAIKGDVYIDPFYPRFWKERIEEIKPSGAWWDTLGGRQVKGIFVCDMGELFGDWLPYKWQEQVFDAIKSDPLDRFYLLTKQPQNLIKFSPFPENCWVGVTATNDSMFRIACANLAEVQAKMKYISFEPLLDWSNYFSTCGLKEDNSLGDNWMKHAGIKWVINGAMTGSLEDIKKMLMVYPQLTPMPWGKRWTLQPKIEWVEEIEKACNKAGIPVFEKNNLSPLLDYNLRQEMPK